MCSSLAAALATPPLPSSRQNAIRNGLESEVTFVLLLMTYVGAGQTGAAPYVYAFVGARTAHAACFLLRAQPYRTITFVAATIVILGLAVRTALAVF